MMNDQRPYSAYLNSLRSHVCVVCLDGRGDGSCGLDGRTCAIQSHLPQVVEAFAAVQSTRMDDYATAMESKICASCEQVGPHGDCRLRDRGECGLATYLYLVVDAIEEATANQSAATGPAVAENPPRCRAMAAREVLDLGIGLPPWHQFGSDPRRRT